VVFPHAVDFDHLGRETHFDKAAFFHHPFGSSVAGHDIGFEAMKIELFEGEAANRANIFGGDAFAGVLAIHAVAEAAVLKCGVLDGAEIDIGDHFFAVKYGEAVVLAGFGALKIVFKPSFVIIEGVELLRQERLPRGKMNTISDIEVKNGGGIASLD